MKNIIRILIVAVFFSPLIIGIYLTSVFTGKGRAIELWGPFVTSMAKSALRFWVPRIESAEDFDSFPLKMKQNFRLWKPLYDVEIKEETSDCFKLNIRNCPFCEVLSRTGLSKMGPFVCKGDW